MRPLRGATALGSVVSMPLLGACSVIGLLPVQEPATDVPLGLTRLGGWETKLFQDPWVFPLSADQGRFLAVRSQTPTRGIPAQDLMVYETDTMTSMGTISRLPSRQEKAQMRFGFLTEDRAVWSETTSTQLSLDGWAIYSAPLDHQGRQSGPTRMIAQAQHGGKTPAVPGYTEPSMDAEGNVWFSSVERRRGKDRAVVSMVPADGSKPPQVRGLGVGASARGNDLFYVADTEGGQVVRRDLTSGRENSVIDLRESGCSTVRDLVAGESGQAVVALGCEREDRVQVVNGSSGEVVVDIPAKDPSYLRAAGSLVTFTQASVRSSRSRPMLVHLESGEVQELGEGYRMSETILTPNRVGWWTVTGEGKATTNRFSWWKVEN